MSSFILTVAQMTRCNVKRLAHYDEPTEFSQNCGSRQVLCGSFQLFVFVSWHVTFFPSVSTFCAWKKKDQIFPSRVGGVSNDSNKCKCCFVFAGCVYTGNYLLHTHHMYEVTVCQCCVYRTLCCLKVKIYFFTSNHKKHLK